MSAPTTTDEVADLYPEATKWGEAVDQGGAFQIKEFLEWLFAQGYGIVQFKEETFREVHDETRTTYRTVEYRPKPCEFHDDYDAGCCPHCVATPGFEGMEKVVVDEKVTVTDDDTTYTVLLDEAAILGMPPMAIVGMYFNIDQSKLEADRRAMIEDMRKLNESK